MKKYLLVVLLMAGLFLSGCSIFGGGGETDDTTTSTEEEQAEDSGDDNPVITEDILSSVYKVEDEARVLDKAKELYNLAYDKASEWQSDAKLLLVSTKYFSSLDDDGIVDKFIFSSDLQPRYYWSIDISRTDTSKYTRTLIFRDDYILKKGVLAIPVKYWKVTYAAALEKADILGGYQYRQDYPNYQVSQILSLADNKNLAWYIVYTSPDTEDALNLVIDAASGDQIE